MKLAITLIALFCSVLVGCSETSQTTNTASDTQTVNKPVADAREEIGEAIDAVKDLSKQKKDEYMTKMSNELEGLDEKIDKLKERSSELKDDAKAKWEEKLADLQERREEAARKLAEMKDVSGDALEDLKAGFKSAWSELTAAFDEAKSHFKEEA